MLTRNKAKMASRIETTSRGTQTDEYELLLNGMSFPAEFITKDSFNYKFQSQTYWTAVYVCTYSSCQKKAFVVKSNGKVLTRGPDHDHEPNVA